MCFMAHHCFPADEFVVIWPPWLLDSTRQQTIKVMRKEHSLDFLYWRKWIGVICLILLARMNLLAQGTLDSLERVFPTLTGQEKMDAAGEMAFQYCYTNTDKALYYGNMELQLAQVTEDSAAIAQAWNDLAAVYICRGDFQQSLELNLKALAVRQRLGDSLKVAASLSKIGYAHLEFGHLDDALPTFLRAAAIYEAEHQPTYLGMLLNNIGAVHQRQGNSPKAIEYFEKSIAIAEGRGDVANAIGPMANLGMEYFDHGDHAKSKVTFLRLVRLMDSTGIRNNLGTISMNLGVCYMEAQAYDSAIFYFFAADTLFEEKQDKKGLSMVKVDIGICYAKMKAFSKAESFIELGKQYAEETASNVQMKHAYEGLYELAYARGHYQTAVEHLKTAVNYERKIHNEEINEKVAEMETRYQTEKKEKDLAVRNKQLADAQVKAKNQQLAILMLAGGLSLVLAMIALLVRHQRLRRERMLQRARMALQEERLRISRDLHDNIGAELTLISSSLDAHAFKAPDAHTRRELEHIGTFSRNAMAQLRETIWAIRSEAISVDALSLRLMDYTAKLCKPSGILSQVTVSGHHQKKLSPTLTIHLYRLCQEAIHNAVKYADCKTLDILLESSARQLRVRIMDDGKGFDQRIHSEGDGLHNMKARAEEMGGTFSITSQPGKGTTILLDLPC